MYYEILSGVAYIFELRRLHYKKVGKNMTNNAIASTMEMGQTMHHIMSILNAAQEAGWKHWWESWMDNGRTQSRNFFIFGKDDHVLRIMASEFECLCNYTVYLETPDNGMYEFSVPVRYDDTIYQQMVDIEFLKKNAR